MIENTEKLCVGIGECNGLAARTKSSLFCNLGHVVGTRDQRNQDLTSGNVVTQKGRRAAKCAGPCYEMSKYGVF